MGLLGRIVVHGFKKWISVFGSGSYLGPCGCHLGGIPEWLQDACNMGQDGYEIGGNAAETTHDGKVTPQAS